MFLGEGDEPGGDDEHAAVPFAESLAEEFDAAGLFEEPLRFTQRFVFRISGAFHVLEQVLYRVIPGGAAVSNNDR